MSLRYKTRVLPKQAEVLAYRGGEAALRGAVRSGKTWALANWMHDRMEQYPEARHIVIGADLPQLKAGALSDFGVLLKTYGVDYEYRSTDGVYTLKHNGAKLEPVSAEIRQRVLGRSADSIWLEEPQTWADGEQTYYSLHTRMSKSPEGMLYYPEMYPELRMSFNPRQVFIGHWIWKLLNEQKAMPEFVFRTRDNFLMQYKGDAQDGDGIAGYVRAQQRTLPEHLWAVELDGEWATAGGAVYRYYMREWHAEPKGGLPPIAFDPQKPLLWALDFNVGYNCSVVMQPHVQKRIVTGYEPVKPIPGMAQRSVPILKNEIDGYRRRIFYVLDELRLTDAGSPDVVEAFIGRWGEEARCTGVLLYGDGTGGGRGQTMSSASAARSNWAIIADGLNRAGIQWEWRVQSQNPSPQDRVNAVNTQFRNPDGIGMLIDHQRCPYLVRDFQSVKWVEGKNDLDKTSDKSLTHLSDALGYAIWYEHMMERGVDVPLLQRDFMLR